MADGTVTQVVEGTFFSSSLGTLLHALYQALRTVWALTTSHVLGHSSIGKTACWN